MHGIELAARADVIHVIGGGYVNDIWPMHVGLLSGVVAAVRRSGGRAVTSGAGLWPVAPNGQAVLRHLATQFDVLDVRDAPSAGVVEGAATVSRTGDDLFFGLGPHLYRTDGDVREVMICVQSDLVEVGVPALADFLADTLRTWKVSGADLGVIECIPGADRTVFSWIERAFPGARFYPFSEIWDKGMPAAAGQTWISTRFHPHLVAAAVGATGVAVSVSKAYYATKHRSLVERGQRLDDRRRPRPDPRPTDRDGLRPTGSPSSSEKKLELAERLYEFRPFAGDHEHRARHHHRPHAPRVRTRRASVSPRAAAAPAPPGEDRAKRPLPVVAVLEPGQPLERRSGWPGRRSGSTTSRPRARKHQHHDAEAPGVLDGVPHLVPDERSRSSMRSRDLRVITTSPMVSAPARSGSRRSVARMV